MIITPKTKLMQLLDAYPQLEDELMEYMPAFKELKNPILRKTVARIATLQQVASIGRVKVEDLINVLRKEVGQDLFSENAETTYVTEKPAWFDKALITTEFDIRNMLADGEQPVNQAMSDLGKIETNSIYKVIAPFIPAPLIDKASSLNISHWVAKDNDEMV
ncbi:MAG: DUF1858 domain-containing protein, partial [Candidatus Marinimicrobia bacterium]|nr:DUF1858 domain-containing protein [Candidatus Neomarinimicrobiota bacterium]